MHTDVRGSKTPAWEEGGEPRGTFGEEQAWSADKELSKPAEAEPAAEGRLIRRAVEPRPCHQRGRWFSGQGRWQALQMRVLSAGRASHPPPQPGCPMGICPFCRTRGGRSPLRGGDSQRTGRASSSDAGEVRGRLADCTSGLSHSLHIPVSNPHAFLSAIPACSSLCSTKRGRRSPGSVLVRNLSRLFQGLLNTFMEKEDGLQNHPNLRLG